MQEYDFDASIDRRHTASLKWEKYGDKDILPLWVADMDFRSPPSVVQALERRVEHGVYGYGVPPVGLTEIVCETLAGKYGWQVEAEHLVWLPGLVCGLNVACRAVGGEQDEVMSLVPIYPPFLTAPKNSGRRLVTAPLVIKDNRWFMDFEELEKSITPKTRLLLFCNPHNPVGRVFSRREIERLVSLCLKNNIFICSDEIHCDLILDPDMKHIPTATVSPEAAACTITLMAPSKTFNIPGLGCSFAVIENRQLRRRFIGAMAGIVPQVNILGFSAAEAAYREGWQWLEVLLEYLRQNRRITEEAIGAMADLSMCPVEATYLAWIDARRIEPVSPALFFETYGIGLSEGSEFGTPGFVRLNFGCRRPLLQEALKRMEKAVKAMK